MGSVLKDIGFMTIFVFILYAMKKINYLLSQKKTSKIYAENKLILDDNIDETPTLYSQVS